MPKIYAGCTGQSPVGAHGGFDAPGRASRVRSPVCETKPRNREVTDEVCDRLVGVENDAALPIDRKTQHYR